ncbi:MAG: CAP domain-containing protein [Bacteroidota bacterium]|nr:CAP domain-containing protein [Bacteroidota bacterium]
MRQLIFEKTNTLRVEKGLPELILLDSLMDLAQLHSQNMVKHNFYAHIDHLGQNPVQRAEKYNVKAWVRNGNQFTGIAENIAKTPWFENVRGCGDTRTTENLAQCMVTGWKNSPPHYKNILGDFTYLGVGLYFDEMGMGFGTQNFR